MRGSRCSFCGLFAFVTLILLFVGLLLFACIHWHNGWSFFVLVPCLIAFFTPAVCYGYNREDDLHLQDTGNMNQMTFHTCRELGWVVAAMLLLCAYAVPVLAWYNAAFHWGGVITVHVALTCLLWAYILWIRIFVFQT